MEKLIYSFLVILVISIGCSEKSKTPVPVNVSGYETYAIHGTQVQRAVKRHETGKVIEQGYLENGHRTGVWMSFNERDGKLKTLTSFVNGLKEGVYLQFNNREQIDIRALYAADELDGLYSEMQYGRLVKEMDYKKGKIDGLYKEYYGSGKLLKEIQFKDGLMHGYQRYYNEKGEITVQYEFSNGEKVSGGMVK